MVPLRSQGNCGGGRGLSGLHWVWCIGRGPHFQLRQEPQSTSDQTPIAGSLQTEDRRVRPRLGLRHGTPLASRDVPGERGRLSSCIWNLVFFPNDARKNCPFVLTAFTGWSSERRSEERRVGKECRSRWSP